MVHTKHKCSLHLPSVDTFPLRNAVQHREQSEWTTTPKQQSNYNDSVPRSYNNILGRSLVTGAQNTPLRYLRESFRFTIFLDRTHLTRCRGTWKGKLYNSLFSYSTIMHKALNLALLSLDCLHTVFKPRQIFEDEGVRGIGQLLPR